MTTRTGLPGRNMCLPAFLALLALSQSSPKLLLPAARAADPPLRILVLSGQNNHDWRTTTPKILSILTNTGRFQITVTDHPKQFDAPTLKDYDALLSNWNNFGQADTNQWSVKAREAFLGFVREGRGLVVVHAGSSSFPEWNEYHELVGGAWGAGTGHGGIHRFEVRMAIADHPITRGIPPFKTTDELWHRIASRASKTVLATAFSSPQYGGSGSDEAVAFTTKFGQGRCFNLVLGHDVRAMESAGFQALLTRGTEWAATGKVTLPAPSPEAAEDLDGLLNAAAGYDLARVRDSLRAIESTVESSSKNLPLRQALARKMAARLASRDVSLDARKFFCWQISLIGSDEQVPAVAPFLSDTNLSYYARLALERIPGDQSLVALREALPKASGAERIGIINSLAVRVDARAVPDLATVAKGNDQAAAKAAILAIGQIGVLRTGTTAALRSLSDLEPVVPPALKTALHEAQLLCAESLLHAKKTNEATSVLEKLSLSAESPAVRAAAFELWASAEGPEVSQKKILAALKGNDAVLCQAALQALKTADASVLVAASHLLGSLQPGAETILLTILAERRATGALPNILRVLESKDARVRVSAISALGTLGDALVVPPLTSLLAATADANERAAIGEALARLPGKGVEEALLSTLNHAKPEVQLAVIKPWLFAAPPKPSRRSPCSLPRGPPDGGPCVGKPSAHWGNSPMRVPVPP